MPAQPKKPKQPERRPLPNLAAAWDYMADEDRRVVEEVIKRYERFVERPEGSFFAR